MSLLIFVWLGYGQEVIGAKKINIQKIGSGLSVTAGKMKFEILDNQMRNLSYNNHKVILGESYIIQGKSWETIAAISDITNKDAVKIQEEDEKATILIRELIGNENAGKWDIIKQIVVSERKIEIAVNTKCAKNNDKASFARFIISLPLELNNSAKMTVKAQTRKDIAKNEASAREMQDGFCEEKFQSGMNLSFCEPVSCEITSLDSNYWVISKGPGIIMQVVSAPNVLGISYLQNAPEEKNAIEIKITLEFQSE